MNIKLASEKTGLTKKAIKYYESEGLIAPSKGEENHYREYVEEDLVRLNLIGSLRALEVPVEEIRHLLAGNKSMPEVLNEALERIEASIDSLEKSKLIIHSLMEKRSLDGVGEEVKRLRETLELSMEGKKKYVSDALLRAFPGSFGAVLLANYEPFLEIALEGDEKKRTWLRFVDFLDDLDEFAFQAEPPAFTEMGAGNAARIRALLSGDPAAREAFKESIRKVAKLIEENEAFRTVLKTHPQLQGDALKELERSSREFERYLAELNGEYRRYQELVEGIKAEVERETGNDLKALLPNH